MLIDFEYIDIERTVMYRYYYNYIEDIQLLSYDERIGRLAIMLKNDPYFMDSYSLLYQEYINLNYTYSANNILEIGYKQIINILDINDKSLKKLSWRYIQNKHIIRFLINYGINLWLNNKINEALNLLLKVLKLNTSDPIGIRYYIMAIKEGFKSKEAFEAYFAIDDTSLEYESIKNWFAKNLYKYQILNIIYTHPKKIND